MINFSYTIKEGEHAGETLWSGRYCCVAGIILCHNGNQWTVLAMRRSDKCPDNKGLWCLPCGFLEANENGQQGISRETLEETNICIFPEDFKFITVETDPCIANKAHVTLFYGSVVKKMIEPYDSEESYEVSWIPITEVGEHVWAFHHEEYIYKYASYIRELFQNSSK